MISFHVQGLWWSGGVSGAAELPILSMASFYVKG